MERLLHAAYRQASLPYGFSLTSASVSRPLHIRWPTVASLLTVSAASANQSNPSYTSGCPVEDIDRLWKHGISFEPVTNWFRSWWKAIRDSASPEVNGGAPWPAFISGEVRVEPVPIDYVVSL